MNGCKPVDDRFTYQQDKERSSFLAAGQRLNTFLCLQTVQNIFWKNLLYHPESNPGNDIHGWTLGNLGAPLLPWFRLRVRCRKSPRILSIQGVSRNRKNVLDVFAGVEKYQINTQTEGSIMVKQFPSGWPNTIRDVTMATWRQLGAELGSIRAQPH